MEIRYIRKLMTSHMVISQTEALSEWEEKMIAHSSLENVLFADCICEDCRIDLWYDITGKQAIDVLFEDRELGYDLLCRILMGIYEAVEDLEGILLRAESLLLLPECIFLDYELERVYLCYYPGNTTPIKDVFLQFMEYVLTKLDHDDERAVELAYEIYSQAMKSGWSLRQIKAVVCLSYAAEVAEETDAPQENPAEYIENEAEEVQKKESAVRERGEKNYFMRIGAALFKKLPDSFRNIIEKINVICDVQERLVKKNLSRDKRKDEEERFVFEPEKEAEEKVSRPTVLLSELTRPPEGILRYEGNGACGNLTITDAEYLIGSEPSCQGYIPSKTVSRRHARITQVDDIYFVEDLNSSNGTYVGGEMLNYKTKVSLQKNEIIIFADEKFRFI